MKENKEIFNMQKLPDQNTTESGAKVEDRNLPSDIGHRDSIREEDFQNKTHKSRIRLVRVLYYFIMIYFIVFLAFIGILYFNALGYMDSNDLEYIKSFFNFTLIPILLTALTINFRFSNVVTKIIESFGKNITNK